MARVPKRPDPFRVGEKPPYTVRPIGESDEDGWLWRLEWYVGRKDDSGRTSKLKTAPLGRHSTSAAAQAAAFALIQSGRVGPTGTAPVVGRLRTLEILLRAFKAAVLADPQRPRSTKLSYSSHIDRLVGRLGDVPCDPVPSFNVLDKFRRATISDGYHPNTVKTDLAILGAAWTWGRERNHVEDVALPRVEVKVPEREPYTPPVDDIRRVLARLDAWRAAGDAPAWVPLAARLVWATGGRRTEVALLRRGDVRLLLDAEEPPYAVLQLGRHEGGEKTGHRSFPVGDQRTALALAAWLEANPGAPDDGLWARAPRTVEEVSDWMGRACKAEGVPRFTAQPVRRAVTDALFDAGADPKTEAELIGHSDQTAMKYYRKPRASTMANAVLRAGIGAVESKDGKVVDFTTGKRRE